MSPPRPRTRSTARSAQDREAPQDTGPAQEGRAGKAPSRPGPSSDELRGLLEPFVTDAGFELDALDVRAPAAGTRSRSWWTPTTESGLDDIARLSRAASDELDSNEHLVGGLLHAGGHLARRRPAADRSAALAARPPAPGDGPPAARPTGRRGLHRPGRGGGRRRRHAAGRRRGCARCATPTSRTPACRSSSGPPPTRRSRCSTPACERGGGRAVNVDIAALRTIEREKDIPFETVIEAIETALLTAYKHTEGHQVARPGRHRPQDRRRPGDGRRSWPPTAQSSPSGTTPPRASAGSPPPPPGR